MSQGTEHILQMFESLWQADRFLNPWVFGMLALLPVLAARWRPRRSFAALELPTASWLVRADHSWRARLAWLPRAVAIAGLTLLITAGARPQRIIQTSTASTNAVAIQLCIDRSSSMLEVVSMSGQSLSRLDAVKAIAGEFILGNGGDLKGRAGDLIGATVFAGFAETVCPPVREHSALAGMISRIGPAQRVLREDGTAIGDGITSAVARLVRAERALADLGEDRTFTIKSKVVILMTDGRSQQGVSPIDAAEFAAAEGVRIYAIGIGAPQNSSGGLFSMLSGSAIDERLLSDIADMTGGRFWYADSADTLREIYAQIDSLEATEIQSESDSIAEELFAAWAALGLVLIALERVLAATVFRRVA